MTDHTPSGRHSLRTKRVMRWDRDFRCFRLCRVMWQRGTVGDGRGYSVILSLALRPKFVGWRLWDGRECEATILGLRVHYQRSYGGIHV